MREIKFRAWDKGVEKMVDSPSIPFIKGWLGDDKVCCINCLFNKTQDRLVWNQFTGHYDKNSREIFEGDILREDEFHPLFRVDWNDTEARFDLIFSGYNTDFSRHFRDVKVMEVIGNIYQNPELLERISK